MTDKVQKIREEVVRMHNLLPVMDGDNISVNYADRICTTLEMYIDSLQEEPVSEDFEQALAKEWQSYIDRGSATVDALEDNTQELSFAKGFYWGAQWQKKRLISKACEWLEEHDTRNYEVLDDFSRIYVVDNQKMIDDFRKALEK